MYFLQISTFHIFYNKVKIIVTENFKNLNNLMSSYIIK